MIAPVIKAINADMNTAAAARSLINLTSGLCSGEIKSMILSMEVLKISADHTKPVTITSKMISVPDNLTNMLR